MKRLKTFKPNKTRAGACPFITIFILLISLPAQAATVTKTIGTSSRDYTTFTLWEADLDDTGIYSASDDAVGEAYNDAAFDESVTINGGGTVGLSSTELTAASDQRHDGTAGSGVRIVASAARSVTLTGAANVDLTWAWVEIDANGNHPTDTVLKVDSGTPDPPSVNVHHVIHHGDDASSGNHYGIQLKTGTNNGPVNVHNNLIYDIVRPDGTGTASVTGIHCDITIAEFHILNNTIVNIDDASPGTPTTLAGISASDGTNGSSTVKNNVVFNVTESNGSSASPVDFDFGSDVHDYNASEDATATGGNSLNTVSSSDFVSTTGGSEDLHLAAGAVEINTGTDLGTSPAGVNIDINGSDRDALTATTWDMGAHQYENIGSIGTSSRDYTTFTLWEADLDDTTIYGPGARARGDAYNDAAFDESVTINGGSTAGLDGITLSVAGTERHDGTSGTGARSVITANPGTSQAAMIQLSEGIDTTIEWLELNGSGAPNYAVTGLYMAVVTGAETIVGRYLIAHGLFNDSGAGSTNGIYQPGNNAYYRIYDNFIYDVDYNGSSNSATASGIRGGAGIYTTYCQNNSVYNVSISRGSSTTDPSGIFMEDDADENVQNNIATNTTTAGSGTAMDFNPSSPSNASVSYNISSDTTASGTGSLTSKSAADQFVSTAGGSEDLHLKAGADAINAGTDLGTTPTGVEIDIDGRDRDAKGDNWDIGADELVSAARRVVYVSIQ